VKHPLAVAGIYALAAVAAIVIVAGALYAVGHR